MAHLPEENMNPELKGTPEYVDWIEVELNKWRDLAIEERNEKIELRDKLEAKNEALMKLTAQIIVCFKCFSKEKFFTLEEKFKLLKQGGE